MPLALIGLGSNLGDRENYLISAWEKLGEISGIELLTLSRFYETQAVGGPLGQPDFLNAAGLIRPQIDPQKLLQKLFFVENQLGRIRLERWGSRTIDLDLLLYDFVQISNENLVLPHPRMHERRFVLEPANEICPNFQHPTLGKTVSELFCDFCLKNGQKQRNSLLFKEVTSFSNRPDRSTAF